MELLWSLVCVELVWMIGGAVLFAVGWRLSRSSPAPGYIVAAIGVFLALRTGVFMQFTKICDGRRSKEVPLCCFRTNKQRAWTHSMGFEVPLVEFMLPMGSSAQPSNS